MGEKEYNERFDLIHKVFERANKKWQEHSEKHEYPLVWARERKPSLVNKLNECERILNDQFNTADLLRFKRLVSNYQKAINAIIMAYNRR